MNTILGIDVGATGIKGGVVDVDSGEMISDKIKYKTPKPATPKAVIQVMRKIVEDLEWVDKPIGVGFPSIIKHGHSHSASNIDKEWINYPILEKFKKKLSRDIIILNDADAAGIAEQHYSEAISEEDKVVIMLTLGTGIGSAVFVNGNLMPNTELGQLKWKKSVTEHYAANSVRLKQGLSWKDWAKELDAVIRHYDFVFNPDKFILGGGVSKRYKEYKKYMSLDEKIVTATLLNNAGITGAALMAHRAFFQTGIESI